MRKYLLLTSVLLLVFLLSCEKNEEVNQETFLKGEWTQSYEERTSEEIEIYRPSDYKEFPSSWYRQTFYFEDDNICEYSVLAPDDGHYMARGKWKYNEKTNIVEISNSETEIIYKLQVIELSANLLKVKAHH